MARAAIIEATVYQNSSPILMARIAAVDGTYLVPSLVSTLRMTVTRLNSAVSTSLIYQGNLTPSDVIFTSLLVDDLWNGKDEIGYNFRYTVPATYLPTNAIYRFDYKFTLTSGYVIRAGFQVRTLIVYDE